MKCTNCSTEFESQLPPEMHFFSISKVCPPCVEIMAAERRVATEKRELAVRKYEWTIQCPPAFIETNIDKLPFPQKAEQVLQWEYSPKGLILYGATRKGKTRAAWLLIQKLFMQGRNFRVMDSMAGFEYAGIFSEGGNNALNWVTKRSTVPVLFLDDVFKVKLTDSFEAAIFAIVDHRMNHQLPIICTLNDTGDTLSSRMTDDRGNAFTARLKEMCDMVHF